MNASLALIAQFLLPMPIGYAIARYLRGVTRTLLVDLCGTAERADFWTRITMVLLVLGPLTLTLMFAGGTTECTSGDALCVVSALRSTIVHSLLGAILPLLVIAMRIARQVPCDPNAQVAAAAAAQAPVAATAAAAPGAAA